MTQNKSDGEPPDLEVFGGGAVWSGASMSLLLVVVPVSVPFRDQIEIYNYFINLKLCQRNDWLLKWMISIKQVLEPFNIV